MFLQPGFFQNAYVARDLEKAMAMLEERHGISNFIRFDPDMEVTTAYGSGNCKVKVALAWAGPVQIEIVEPISGMVRHYAEFLPEDYSLRFHHICMRVEDWDATVAEVERNKWPIAYQGAVEGCNFLYLDARDTLGHYLEYMWLSPEMWAGIGAPQSARVQA